MRQSQKMCRIKIFEPTDIEIIVRAIGETRTKNHTHGQFELLN